VRDADREYRDNETEEWKAQEHEVDTHPDVIHIYRPVAINTQTPLFVMGYGFVVQCAAKQVRLQN